MKYEKSPNSLSREDGIILISTCIGAWAIIGWLGTVVPWLVALVASPFTVIGLVVVQKYLFGGRN